MNLDTIKRWFENYDRWVNQARRKEGLGLVWKQEDKILGITYHSREELDLKAEEMEKLHKQEKENIKQRAIEWRKSKGLGV